MIAATGCKQAPPAQMETEYEVMTVVPADRMISSAYSATIRGRHLFLPKRMGTRHDRLERL